jgi:hypothetical protein
MFITSKTCGYRIIFLLVPDNPDGKSMAQRRTIEKCAYCDSKEIQHPRTSSVRQNIVFILNLWFSPNCKRETVEKCECVGCCSCSRNYQKTKFDRKRVLTLSGSLIPLSSALQNFRDIFANNAFDEWVRHVLAIVVTESGAMHIIFRLCRIKAYLDCQKIQGRFVIVSVELL